MAFRNFPLRTGTKNSSPLTKEHWSLWLEFTEVKKSKQIQEPISTSLSKVTSHAVDCSVPPSSYESTTLFLPPSILLNPDIDAWSVVDSAKDTDILNYEEEVDGEAIIRAYEV